MTVQVRAKSDKGVFLAFQEDEGYLVFSLDDSVEISLGDILSSPEWDDGGDGLWKTVKNLTQTDEAYICLENWSMGRTAAYELLGRLNYSTKIFSIEK